MSFVTKIRLHDNAGAAIMISMSSIILPFRSNVVLISPEISMTDLSMFIAGNSSAILQDIAKFFSLRSGNYSAVETESV